MRRFAAVLLCAALSSFCLTVVFGRGLNCLQAGHLCREDERCAPRLDLMPEACGPPDNCNADNLRFCLGALQGIQHHNYFRPRCNCNQSAVSPVFFQMCLDLRNAIYHHHCARLQPIRIRHQKRKLAAQRLLTRDSQEVSLAALNSVTYADCAAAFRQCQRHSACEQLWKHFRMACATKGNRCLMTSKQACYEAFEGIRWTPLGNCTCLNEHAAHGATCHKILLITAHNRCVKQLQRENYRPPPPPPLAPSYPHYPGQQTHPGAPQPPYYYPYPPYPYVYPPIYPVPFPPPYWAQQPQPYPTAPAADTSERTNPPETTATARSRTTMTPRTRRPQTTRTSTTRPTTRLRTTTKSTTRLTASTGSPAEIETEEEEITQKGQNPSKNAGAAPDDDEYVTENDKAETVESEGPGDHDNYDQEETVPPDHYDFEVENDILEVNMAPVPFSSRRPPVTLPFDLEDLLPLPTTTPLPTTKPSTTTPTTRLTTLPATRATTRRPTVRLTTTTTTTRRPTTSRTRPRTTPSTLPTFSFSISVSKTETARTTQKPAVTRPQTSRPGNNGITVIPVFRVYQTSQTEPRFRGTTPSITSLSPTPLVTVPYQTDAVTSFNGTYAVEPQSRMYLRTFFGGPPDVQEMAAELGIELVSTCQDAYQLCRAHYLCSSLLVDLENSCQPDNCVKPRCAAKIRELYNSMDIAETVAKMTFCTCRTGDTECESNREILFPSCQYQLTESEILDCLELEQRCRATDTCRNYMFDCAVRTRSFPKCIKNSSVCRVSLAGVRGTQLETDCVCQPKLTKQKQTACERFRNVLPDRNSCLKESAIQFHSATSSSTITTTVTPESTTPSTTKLRTTTTSTSTSTSTTTSTTTTTTTTFSKLCRTTIHGKLVEVRPNHFIRNYSSPLSERICSKLCQCSNSTLKFSCPPKKEECVADSEKLKCKGDLINHDFGDTVFVKQRGRCTCFLDGEYVCQLQFVKDDSAPYNLSSLNGLFFLGGFSTKELKKLNSLEPSLKLIPKPVDKIREALNHQVKLGHSGSATDCRLKALWDDGVGNFIFRAEAFTTPGNDNTSEASPQWFDEGKEVEEVCYGPVKWVQRQFESGAYHHLPLLSTVKQVTVMDYTVVDSALLIHSSLITLLWCHLSLRLLHSWTTR